MRRNAILLILCLTAASAGLWAGSACSNRTLLNQTASFGGSVTNQRGHVRVLFLNNTPFRAIFTYGTHSNTDRDSNPDFHQFTGVMGQMTLEANSFSTIQMVNCDRVFSVGGAELLQLIGRNSNTNGASFDRPAFTEGIAFSSAAIGSEDAEAPTEGLAAPLEALLGVDFPCGAMLIVRFEQDDALTPPLRFRADFSMIPASSDRGT
ncbi:MAG TPA: hypothetical protein VGM03_14750 [Phycisphaerae bacterium]